MSSSCKFGSSWSSSCWERLFCVSASAVIAAAAASFAVAEATAAFLHTAEAAAAFLPATVAFFLPQ